MIIIACKYDPTRPVVQRAVASARKFLPNERVLVVDSDSDDKSYFKDVIAMGAEIADIKNKNYDTAAYWYGYKNNRDEKFFFCMHDSSYFVATPPPELYDTPVTTFMKWKNQNPHTWDMCIGPEIEWGRQQLSQTSVPFLYTGFNMVFGPIFFVQAHILQHLEELGFDKVTVENKVPGVGGSERLWGIAFAAVGHRDFPVLTPWISDHRAHEYKNDKIEGAVAQWFAKTWLFRDHPY